VAVANRAWCLSGEDEGQNKKHGKALFFFPFLFMEEEERKGLFEREKERMKVAIISLH
jgi:hypothetical protein